MTTTKQRIVIKGNKEGLHFKLDSNCSYEELTEELDQKLRVNMSQFLQGPLTHVYLHVGERYLTKGQRQEITELIERTGNLRVKDIHTDVISIEEARQMLQNSMPKVEVGLVRSGQVLESDQDILILGDVNPGGWVVSSGNIYVMGALKGIAHAGKKGDRNKIVAASWMEPTQLRIADVIYNSFPSWEQHDRSMLFGYLEGDKIQFGRIQYLKQIRPHASISFDQEHHLD